MSDTNKIFRVQTETGEIKEAELLKTFNKNNIKYAIYSIDNEDGNSNLYASKITVDENGNPKLVDIENNNEKEEAIKYIKEIINQESGVNNA